MNWKFWKKEKKVIQVLDWTEQCFKIGGYMYTFYGDVFVDEDGVYYDSHGFPIEYIELSIVDPFNDNKACVYGCGHGIRTRRLWLQSLSEYKDSNNLIEDKVSEISKWAEEVRNKFETIKNRTYSHSYMSNVLDKYYNVTLLKKYVDNKGDFYITVKYSDLFGNQSEERNMKMTIEYFEVFEEDYHNELTEIK